MIVCYRVLSERSDKADGSRRRRPSISIGRHRERSTYVIIIIYISRAPTDGRGSKVARRKSAVGRRANYAEKKKTFFYACAYTCCTNLPRMNRGDRIATEIRGDPTRDTPVR